MSEYTTFDRLHDRVYRLAVPFEGGGVANVYLVRGSKTALIDSAVSGAPTQNLAPALAQYGLKLGDVSMVLNTHGHMDHTGGNGEMKDAGAEIAMHSQDAVRAGGHQTHLDIAGAAMRKLGLDAAIPAREAVLLRLLGKEVACDRQLEEGDVVDLGSGVRLQVVHTPGHTPGAVCYWWEEADILFTGDSIQARGSRVGGMPVLENPEWYTNTLSKAESIGASSLFMGHAFKGPDGDLGPVARGVRVAEVFRESREVHAAWLAAMKQAVTDLPNGPALDRAMRAAETLRERYGLNDADSGLPTSGTMTMPGYLDLAGS